jgi:hypothetical protein
VVVSRFLDLPIAVTRILQPPSNHALQGGGETMPNSTWRGLMSTSSQAASLLSGAFTTLVGEEGSEALPCFWSDTL